jgi:hypothetical protein
MAYVYRHIRTDKNEVFYIGIGIRENYRRATTIVSRNAYWKNIVAKTKWYPEILFDEISLEEANIKEIEFIKLYGRKDLGDGTLANMTNGGDGTKGYIVTQAMKDNLSFINKGKKLSDEHKYKISQAHIGKVFSKITLEKMSNAKKGIKQSLLSIDKRRKKLMGNKSNLGKKLPIEQKIKMAASQKRRRYLELKGKVL